MYTFDQLNHYGKANAMSRYNDAPPDWCDEIIANAKRDGPARGFDVEDVAWSGFHSQGDGASWTGSIHIPTFIEYHNKPDTDDFSKYVVLAELIKDGWTEMRVEVARHGYYYSHSNTMHVSDISDNFYNANDDATTRIDAGILEGADVYELIQSIGAHYMLDELQGWMESKAKQYADEIFKQLRDEYDAYTSEELFKDICDINEWRFDYNGYLIEQE